jgi:hypothetical protein
MSKLVTLGLALVIFISGAVYLASVPSAITGIADSDELITAAVAGAIPHPPGYPLFTSLLSWWLKLPVWSSPYWGANAFNAMVQAMANGFFFLTLVAVLAQRQTKRRQKGQVIMAALSGTLVVAFSYGIWMYAAITEVFAFSHLLLAITLWLTVRLRGQQNLSRKWLWAFVLVMALMVGHHQLTLLTLPFFIAGVWPRTSSFKGRFLLTLAFAMVVSGAVHFGLLWRLDQNQSVLSWNYQPTASGWWHMVSRSDYSGLQIESGEVAAAYLGAINIEASVGSLWHYLSVTLPDHFGLTLLVLVWGGYVVFRHLPMRKWWWWLLMGLVLGPGVAGYLTLPSPKEADYQLILGLTERMYLLGFWFYSLIFGIGIFTLWQRRSSALAPIFLTGLLLVGYQLVRNRELFELPKERLAYLWLTKTLDLMPQNGLIICFSDASCFGLRALQTIDHRRPDVTVLPATPQMAETILLKQPKLMTMPYKDNPFMVLDMIGTHVSQTQPVVLMEPPTLYLDLLGLDRDVLMAQPIAGGMIVGCPIPEFEISPVLSDPRGWKRQRFYQALAEHLTQFPRASIPQCLSLSQLELAYQACEGVASWQCRLKTAMALMLREPANGNYRLLLAQAMRESGNVELAKREYYHVLLLEPDDAEALEWLETLAKVPYALKIFSRVSKPTKILTRLCFTRTMPPSMGNVFLSDWL